MQTAASEYWFTYAPTVAEHRYLPGDLTQFAQMMLCLLPCCIWDSALRPWPGFYPGRLRMRDQHGVRYVSCHSG